MGIARPRPIGALDRLAWVESNGRLGASFDEPLRVPFQRVSPQAPSMDDMPSPEAMTVLDMRVGLMITLDQYRRGGETPVAAMHMSAAGLPILSSEQSGRLLKLIQPLQLSPAQDLPLLVWEDPEQGVLTSWPDGGRRLWTPIEVGLSRPEDLLLVHPDQSGDRADTPILSNCSPETNHVLLESSIDDTRGLPTQLLPKNLAVDVDPVSDEETVSGSTKKHEPWRELGRPDFGLYLAIEETLRASVLLGAAAYRARRVRGVDGPCPSSGLELVATLLSFESLDDMPDDLAATCRSFAPESDHDSADTFRADVERRLLRILLERNHVETLRNHLFTIDDLPLLGNEEGNMMRTRVAPLEDENGGSR